MVPAPTTRAFYVVCFIGVVMLNVCICWVSLLLNKFGIGPYRFPLYSRGKDKKLFQYAAFLLNKNIENLRYILDLHTKDLKSTLRNLKDMLHNKFGVG